ncbi:MAG: hypothetical protein Q7T05_01285 [Dehalococcoidia bacterium]|nr:hypothetical protein [Dehalococcoidia bacterium]
MAISYPWIAVVLAAALLFISAANSNTFGVFFKPIAEQFGWSRGAVSVAISIRWAVVACLVMPLGYLSRSIRATQGDIALFPIDWRRFPPHV